MYTMELPLVMTNKGKMINSKWLEVEIFSSFTSIQQRNPTNITLDTGHPSP